MAADTATVIAAASLARDSWSDWADRGSLAVLAGVVLEIIDLESLSTRLGLHDRPKIKDAIAAVGLILVVAGLATEYRAGTEVHKQTVIIEASLGAQSLADARAAVEVGRAALNDADAATSAASSAQFRASAASDEIDRMAGQEKALRAEIQSDEMRLNDERKARNAMLEQERPRDITEEQVKSIASAVKGHTGLIYLYALCDPEAAAYSWEVTEALTKSGYTVNHAFANPLESGKAICFDKFEVRGVSSTGLSLLSNEAERKDMFVLMGALANAHVDITVGGGIADRSILHPAIFVGLKAPPFQQFPALRAPPDLAAWMKKHPPAWKPD